MFKNILFLLMTAVCVVTAQTWQNTITLSPEITLYAGDRIDLFTNQDGNHIIVQQSSQLRYFLFTYNGQLVRSSVIDNVNESPHLSCVTGWNNKVYVIYKKGSYIYAKRTENAGQSWTSITGREMDYSVSNGLEVYSDELYVHMAWSEKYGSPNHYETNYSKLSHSQNYWTDFKQVTDYGSEQGGAPSITVSPSSNRIYVTYNTRDESNPYTVYPGQLKMRIKDSNSWLNPETAHYLSVWRGNALVDNNDLFMFYYEAGDISYPPGTFDYHIAFKSRDKDDDNDPWSTAQNVTSGTFEDINDKYKIDIVKTENNYIHFAYSGDQYREYNTSLSSAYDFGNGYNQRIDGNGNDVYIA